MKLGMDHIELGTHERLKFLQQMGVEGVMLEPEVKQYEKGHFEFTDFMDLRTRVEAYDMKLASSAAAIRPWQWNYKWMMGLPGRDEQIENVQKTITNMGAAGVPICTYDIHALAFFRTSRHTPVRGGALATSFDASLVENAPLMTGGPRIDTSLIPESQRRAISDDEMWDNLTYFLKAVVPVAEESGVKLALHPDDPQVPSIGGVARIMRSPAAFRRAIEIVPSDNNGLLFCQGCFTEMGADVLEEIRYFGSRKKIFWVHFRNIKGTFDRFNETFPDEGQMDMEAAMKTYREVGYDGHLTPDHKLGVVGDDEWGSRYWAYALGYIRALIQSTE